MSDQPTTIDTNDDSAVEETVTTEELQARIAQLEKEAAEYKDSWLRSAAEFKNYKRRTEQERLDLIRSASGALLLKLLPVMDDLDRAQDSVPADIADTAWYGGFKLIPQKLQALLESEGVKPIAAAGQPFDPSRHEAVIFD